MPAAPPREGRARRSDDSWNCREVNQEVPTASVGRTRRKQRLIRGDATGCAAAGVFHRQRGNRFTRRREKGRPVRLRAYEAGLGCGIGPGRVGGLVGSAPPLVLRARFLPPCAPLPDLLVSSPAASPAVLTGLSIK